MQRFLLLLMGLLVAGGAFGWVWAQRLWVAPGPLATPVQLVIPRGANGPAIGALLAEAKVVADARSFAAAAWITRDQGPLRAAEFVFPPAASLQQVLDILRRARPVQRRLTIPEGLTIRQILPLLERAEGLAGDTPAFAEAALLPETYIYQWGDTRAALVTRADTAMDAALAEAWAARAPNLPLASPRDALVLASIIERETARPEERARVAGVFVNRLRRGMPLQSDPTVAYAAAAGPLDRPITRADLDRDHPFNTYRIRGLPPGPIAAPGVASLRAATRPEAHEFLYFVADGAGGHAFGRTLEEHNANVARWRALTR